MGVTRIPVLGVVLVALLATEPAGADTVRLKNGSALQVDGWRDVGDAIEFAFGGGIVRIGKDEIERVEGRPTAGDLLMYSAPPEAGAAAGGDRGAAVKQMAELLKQGEGLAGQTVLTAAEKASALRRLGETWKGLRVPEALRELHAQGQQALQLLAEAYAAEGGGASPDARERVEKAKSEMQAAQDEVRKAGEAG
jgi:hypothetical protein